MWTFLVVLFFGLALSFALNGWRMTWRRAAFVAALSSLAWATTGSARPHTKAEAPKAVVTVGPPKLVEVSPKLGCDLPPRVSEATGKLRFFCAENEPNKILACGFLSHDDRGKMCFTIEVSEACGPMKEVKRECGIGLLIKPAEPTL